MFCYNVLNKRKTNKQKEKESTTKQNLKQMEKLSMALETFLLRIPPL